MHQASQKKQIYIGPTILHILPSQLLYHIQSHLLLLQKRHLHLLTLSTQSLTSCKLPTQHILHTTFHPSLQVYLIKTNKQVYFVNQVGQLIGRVNITGDRLFNQARFFFLVQMEDGQMEDTHCRIDRMVFITEENMYITPVNIQFERGMLKNKRLTKFKIELVKQPVQNHIDPSVIIDSPEWVDNCKIFKQLNLLVCYNKQEVTIFKLPKNHSQGMELHRTYRKISSKIENRITDVCICSSYQQLLLSQQSGAIKIYSLSVDKKYIFQLRGHQKPCTSLLLSFKSLIEILYSSGLDNTIRLWNILQFQQLYCLRIDIICDQIRLISDQLAFVKGMGKTSLVRINAYKMEYVQVENTNGRILQLNCDQDWLVTTWSTNFCQMTLIQHEQQIPTYPLSNHQQSYTPNHIKHYSQKIQFPLKYGSVVSAMKLRQNQYAIILQKGFSLVKLNKNQIKQKDYQLKKLAKSKQLLKLNNKTAAQQQNIDQIYNVHQQSSHNKYKSIPQNKFQQQKKPTQLIHQKLLGTYLFNIIEDWKGIPTAINVTYLTFVTGKKIPMWDMDQKSKLNGQNQRISRLKNHTQAQIHAQQDQVHIVIGTQKGVIYIINLLNKLKFQTRVIMHSGAIQFVQQFHPTKQLSQSVNGQIFWLSYDKHKQFCFWSISQSCPPITYCRVSSYRNISHLSVHECYLLIGQKQGRVSILQLFLEEQQQSKYDIDQISLLKRKSSIRSSTKKHSKLMLKQTKNQGQYGHMKVVNAGDYIYYKQKYLFITASQDCTIKMWLGLQKVLLFQLKIFDPISHLKFKHHGIDFIMAHNNQITAINQKNIAEITKIDNQLDKNHQYQQIHSFNVISVRTFFAKQQFIQNQVPKRNHSFRLKMKNSFRPQPMNINLNQSVEISNNRDLINKVEPGFLSNIPQQGDDEISRIKIIEQISQHRKQASCFLSPQGTSKSKPSKSHQIYSHSQQKLNKKRSFHIVNTSLTKQLNQQYFILPKISTLQSKNKSIKPVINTLNILREFQLHRERTFSSAGRYKT